MSDSWNDFADGWDDNPAVINYAEQAFASITNTLDIKDLKGLRILDFGCGTGTLSEKLSPFVGKIVALDPADKMIDVLKQKIKANQLANIQPLVAELDQALINNNQCLQPKFDLIVASSSLAFVPDYLAMLILLKQLLKPDALLIQWDWLKAEDQEGSGFSESEITKTYDKAGFSSCTTSLPFSLEDMRVIMALVKP